MVRRWIQRGTPAPVALLLCLALASCYVQLRRALRPVPDADPVSLAIAPFEDLKPDLPARGEVCYFSDVASQQPGDALLFLAQYSLAPLLVKSGADCDLVIGNFANPASALALTQQRGLRIRRSQGGLTLLQRGKP